MSTSTSSVPGGQMTLMEHLTELRKRLIISVIAIAVAMIVVTIFYEPLLDWLIKPYCEVTENAECQLQQIEPTEGLSVRFKVTGYGAIALAMPYMMLAFGAGFEFPILLLFLQLAGIVDSDMLKRGRRYAIVIITVVVAVVTPSGDPFSMLALSVPMIVFYEASIHIGALLARRSARNALT
jgi:Sec-independent protein secretion pathway component TatC